MLGDYFITALGIVKTPCGVFLWQFQCCLPSSCPTPPSHPARQAGDGISCSTTVKYYEMCYFIFSSPTNRPGSQPEVFASAQPRWAPLPFPRLGKSPGTKSILGKSQEQSWRLFPSPAALSGGGGWGRAQSKELDLATAPVPAIRKCRFQATQTSWTWSKTWGLLFSRGTLEAVLGAGGGCCPPIPLPGAIFGFGNPQVSK